MGYRGQLGSRHRGTTLMDDDSVGTLLSAVLSVSSDATGVIRADGVVVQWNAAATRLFGRSAEEIVGRHIRSLAHPDDHARFDDAVRRMKAGDRARLSSVHIAKGNSMLEVNLEFTPLPGVGACFVAKVADISAVRRSDESRMRLAAIVESSEDAILSGTLDGVITTWNRAAERLYGYTAEEALGMPMSALYPPGRLEEMSELFDRLRRGEGVRNYDTVRVRKDGSLVEVSLSLSFVRGKTGEMEASVIARDLTERRLAEQALRRSEERLLEVQKMEAIGILAGGIAHDFNNLLFVILSYATLTIDGLPEDNEMRADMEEVKRAAERAAELTRQLLAFSRKQHLQPRVLQLDQIVMGMEKMLRRLLGVGIDLVLDVPSSLGAVHADPSQMEQVIMNLTVNARDAMPSGGQLTIAIDNVALDGERATRLGLEAGEFVMMTFRDTGTGMDETTRARIFEPFFTTKERGKGTGLGLATVFGVMRQSSGHVSVESELGKGTTFAIYLPLTEEVAERAQRGLLPPPGTRGTETILLVEDDDQVRTAISVILRRDGYSVLEAQNGGEALLICEQHRGTIHLLMTDIIMPRMSGEKLADRLLAQRPDMKVVYVSAHVDDAVDAHGEQAPVTLVQKPVTPHTLLRKTREILGAT